MTDATEHSVAKGIMVYAYQNPEIDYDAWTLTDREGEAFGNSPAAFVSEQVWEEYRTAARHAARLRKNILLKLGIHDA